MPDRYRKKPVPVDAVQLAADGGNAADLAAWSGARVRYALTDPTDPTSLQTFLDVPGSDATRTTTAAAGDWIVSTPGGGFLAVPAADFAATYEPADTEES